MQIIFLHLQSNTWSKTHTQLLKYVSYNRQKKINKYIHTSDKLNSLYAALLTRMKISELTNIPNEQLNFSITEFNKPIFLNLPHINFNFSHSHKGILLCISDVQSIGTDIELTRNAPIELMNTVFHSAEIQYINEKKEYNSCNRFFEIWTQKEAYTKRIGTGFTGNITSINTLALSDSFFYTWKENDYYCTVSYEQPENIKKEIITEKEIHRFFNLN